MRGVFLIALLLPALAAAEIYSWTDEQGRKHFGQKPGSGAETVEVKPQVVERDQLTREREARTQRFYEARREEQQQAAVAAAQQRKKRLEECTGMRRYLAQMPEGRRYFRQESDGSRTYYSDDELDTARRQLRDRIAEHCT